MIKRKNPNASILADAAVGYVSHSNCNIIMCTAQNYAFSTCQSINPDEILECRFRHYLATQTTQVAIWYNQFKQEVYKLLEALGLSNDETDYRLRSYTFVELVCDLLCNESPQMPLDSDLD